MVAVWQHEYDALNQRIATLRPDGHKVSWLTYGSGHLLGMTLDQHEMLAYERDDLHREVVRHQGNQLRQSQSWDPAGSLLQATSRLGVENFAFDPAGNLLEQKTQELNRPLEANPRRNKLMDNLLREYAGSHYKYDERGNLIHRLHNGAHAHFSWDLFDRLVGYNDDKLKVEYSYDALGRRLHKHSVAHYWNKPEAGTGWNQMQRAKRQRELDCRFTLYGWDGDTLAWESSPPRDDGDTGRTVHYLYEPGSFVPVAQALRKGPVRLHKQPDWSNRTYDFDQDPLWHTEVKPQPFDAIAWYHCDHLGTPMELTDEQGHITWAGQYKAWGEVREERSEWASQHGLSNPIRFQGQYHDHETGLHYNRYRYYDPVFCRFISLDPISYAGGINLHLYASNPVGWIDPLGLACGTTRRASLREIRRQLGIPKTQQPVSQKMVRLTDSAGQSILNDSKQPIMTRELTYRVNGRDVIVQDHSAGHYYNEGGVGGQSPHHNVRPAERPRTGSVYGMDDHYYFDCRNKK